MNSFEYYHPESIEETLEVLKLADENTYVLAGGTDLVVLLHKKAIKCDSVISLKKIRELEFIMEENGFIRIGSMSTHSQIEQSELINKKAGILAEACRDIGSAQIRNLGTIGGNIINSSSAADTVTALLALDADCIFKNHERERIVKIKDLFGKNGKATINNDEILKEIVFSTLNCNTVSGFKKLGRRKALAIVVASIGIIIEKMPDEGRCKNIKISLGGISRNPQRAEEAEKILIGKEINCENIEKCLEKVSETTADLLEKSRRAHRAPFKRTAIKEIGLEVFERICLEINSNDKRV